MQSFFPNRGYFEVASRLTGVDVTSPYAVFLNKIAPAVKSIHAINPPSTVNEITPLLSATQWHRHLQPYRENKTQVQQLRSLMQLPTSNRGHAHLGTRLRNVIVSYMKEIRHLSWDSKFSTNCLLMECPRSILFADLKANTKMIWSEFQRMHSIGNHTLMSKPCKTTVQLFTAGHMLFCCRSLAMNQATHFPWKPTILIEQRSWRHC